MTAYLMPLLVAAFIVLHVGSFDLSPNGFHKWREADTATVAENFAQDQTLLYPRVNVLGESNGVVGTELPVYTGLTSLLYRIFGLHHAWPRLLSLLASLGLILGLRRLLCTFGESRMTQDLMAYLTAFSPLVFFYGIKIQPDMFGFALMVWGYLWYREWLTDGRWQGALRWSLALGLAAGIKPIYLFIGLPMLYDLVQKKGWRTLRWPKIYVWVLLLATPSLLWYPHATSLTDRFGLPYFFIGQDAKGLHPSLLDPRFYQNAFLTWPWELAIGLPSAAFFLYGFREAWSRRRGWLIAWVVGCFVVFLPAAGHIATPHDYYYLPMLPCLLYVTALGYRRALAQEKIWGKRLAIGFLCLLPIYAVGRTHARFDYDDRFASAREKVRAAGLADTLTLAVDSTPGWLLYQTGLRGFRLAHDARLSQVKSLVEQGMTTMVVETNDRLEINPTVRKLFRQHFEEKKFTLLTLRHDPEVKWQTVAREAVTTAR